MPRAPNTPVCPFQPTGTTSYRPSGHFSFASRANVTICKLRETVLKRHPLVNKLNYSFCLHYPAPLPQIPPNKVGTQICNLEDQNISPAVPKLSSSTLLKGRGRSPQEKTIVKFVAGLTDHNCDIATGDGFGPLDLRNKNVELALALGLGVPPA